MNHAESCDFGVNNAGTCGEIDTPLTQERSLSVLAQDLMRLRPTLPPAARPYCSNLIEQIKNYTSGKGNRETLPALMRRQMADLQRAMELRDGES